MLEKYLLTPDGFYNINIMLNDYCNNRCTYCRQFSEYWTRELEIEKFKKIYHFFIDAIPKEKRIMLFEWGEPTFYTHLQDILLHIEQEEEKIVVLSNGRIPKNNLWVVQQFLQKDVIDYIWLHVPVANEPLADVWKKDVIDFLSSLPSTLIDKIIIIWLMHSVNLNKKDFLLLLQYREKFWKIIMGNSFCFPHPNVMGRHYIDYVSRLKIMENLIKIFVYMLKNDYPLILDSTLPCILKHWVEYNHLEKTQIAQYFMGNRVSMVKNFEFHIDLEGWIILLSNIAKTCFITGHNMFDYKDFQALCDALNQDITREYEAYFQKTPNKCTNCDYFLRWCTGDHFKLVSQSLSL